VQAVQADPITSGGTTGGIAYTSSGADPSGSISFNDTVGDIFQITVATSNIETPAGTFGVTDATLGILSFGGPFATGSYALAGGPTDTGGYYNDGLFNNPVQATSLDGAFWYDNLLFTNHVSFVDNSGLLFADGQGHYFNIFSTGSTGWIYESLIGGGYAIEQIAPGTFSATGALASVPEPSSLALLGLGGIGLAIGAYRRRRTVAA
jgi:hypothetical protein